MSFKINKIYSIEKTLGKFIHSKYTGSYFDLYVQFKRISKLPIYCIKKCIKKSLFNYNYIIKKNHFLLYTTHINRIVNSIYSLFETLFFKSFALNFLIKIIFNIFIKYINKFVYNNDILHSLLLKLKNISYNSKNYFILRTYQTLKGMKKYAS